MDCATEEHEIRQALSGLSGIAELRFQLASRTLVIRAEPAALGQAETILRRLSYLPQVLEAGTPAAPVAHSVPWLRLIASLLLAAAAEGIHSFLPPSWLHEGLEIALALGAIPLAGLPIYTKGLAALRQGRLNINALMTVAVTGAFLIGHWPEAAMVMALYAIAEALEARAASRARAAISRLMELAPEQARVEQDTGEWQLVSSDIRFWSSGDTKTGPPDGLLMGALRRPLDRCFIGGCRVVVVGGGICAA